MSDAVEPPFLKFLETGVAKGGFEMDDVLVALLPLMKQALAAHAAGLVAPLDGTLDLILAEQGHLMFAPEKFTSPEKNTTKVEAVQSPVSQAVEVIAESRRTTDIDEASLKVSELGVGATDGSVTKPVFLPGYGSWEQAIGHHDELTDIFSLGMLLASVACGLDFTDVGELEIFTRNRANLFGINCRLNPVLGSVIVQMTELNRHKRAPDLGQIISRLENYREQPADVNFDRIDGFKESGLTGKRRLIQPHLRDRLFEVSRRNRLIYFKPTLQTLNLTVASVPLLLDYRKIKLEQLFVWHPKLAASITEGSALSLGTYLRFEDAPYIAGVLDKIISEARRDRAEFGFAQLRLVLCFLRWNNLKEAPNERIHSPLLLLPVELMKKKGVRDNYVLAPATSEAEVNPALRHHLKELYNLNLPEVVDLKETSLDQFYEAIKTQIQASEPGVTLNKIERPQIELIHEKARQRVDQYRRRMKLQARKARSTAKPEYSYDRENFRPLGLQLFLDKVRPTPMPLRDVMGAAPQVRLPHIAAPEAPAESGGVLETERQMFSLRDGDNQNPYAWDFDLCSLTLGNFNYRKMTLVRDYSNLIETDIASGAFDTVFSLSPKPAEDTPPPLDLADQNLIISCDATQASAIARARSGASYIIQGPPGTGKSQTITNLIADYVARGKRVLFVCEKRAAIDVVYHRLCQQGLDELCCLIYDSQTDKKAFIQNLKQTYEKFLGQADVDLGVEQSRVATLRGMEQELAGLRRFSDVMRQPHVHTGVAVRSLLHRLVELRGRACELAAAVEDLLPDYPLWLQHGEVVNRLQSAYRVVVEPGDAFVGTVNEDFAVESMAGDIFQLGNTSWKVLQIVSGTVRVADAQGQPPGMPFWLGEGPARTTELSRAVGRLRDEVQSVIEQTGGSIERLMAWFTTETGVSETAARQLAEYFSAGYKALGVIPSQNKIVMERFFDESGGMQLVIHAPFGARVNRAWGLALRKRFCRSFNFELQAAATDDAIVLSLGTQHSFPLEEVFRYLNSKSVREVLVQALLDAPMFPIRWRWNATRSLALPRQSNGRKMPAPLQRMESENLLAAVFPDQLACLENIAGDREVPDHPLVRQTIEDCLTEAMDIDGLEALLRRIENGEVECVARDLPEPSPLAHEILNARPYAFLDNAPLEERRTQAVHTRRAGDPAGGEGLGILDAAAIARVCAEAWPQARNADELHETLLLLGVMTEDETLTCSADAPSLLQSLAVEHRAGRLNAGRTFWIAAERLSMARAVYPDGQMEPALNPPPGEPKRTWEHSEAVRELVRGRMEVIGPATVAILSKTLLLSGSEIEAALLALETEGFVLRGKFHPAAPELEWCERRLLSRIHRLTLHRLHAEIQPVSLENFQRFLLAWQRVDKEHRAEGPAGVETVLDLLDGMELAAAAWEPEVLALRVKDYTPQWLDQLCLTGRIGWGRLSPPQNPNARASTPLRSTPVSVFDRENLMLWLELSGGQSPAEFTPDTELVLKSLARSGAMFFSELVRLTRLLPSRVAQALGELTARGWVTSDSFEGLRALLIPSEKRAPFTEPERKRRHKTVTSVEFAGRWSLLRKPPASTPEAGEDFPRASDEAVETFARVLLRRYGIVFRRLLERESLRVLWYELGRVYRRLEARGEIRGGHFITGASGEQFALPEAIGLLRSIRRAAPAGELIVINAADPLNLLGILTSGPRVTAITANRILLRDGLPIAVLNAGEVKRLTEAGDFNVTTIEQSLIVGKISPELRPYYA